MSLIKIICSSETAPIVHEYLQPFQLNSYADLVIDQASYDGCYGINFIIEGDIIKVGHDWSNTSIPFDFGELPFDQTNLVGLFLFYSGLNEDALRITAGANIHTILQNILERNELTWLDKYFDDYSLFWNRVIVAQMSGIGDANLKHYYEASLDFVRLDETRAYVTLFYGMFLSDQEEFSKAIQLMEAALRFDGLSHAAKNALQLELVRTNVSKASLTNEAVGQDIKLIMWNTYNYFKEEGVLLQEGQTLLEMTKVAMFESNFAEALGYIGGAIKNFDELEFLELAGEAYIMKADLLHQWAKNGAPQFYQEAIKSYQKALIVFRKDYAPFQFAEIHHQLGILYAEMPEENQKRALWAAISASSFKEALEIFTAERFPDQYASACHNYATALIKYPDAIRSDNMEKAIFYFNEALNLRTKNHPEERAFTLLNYLEACWEVNNVNDNMETVRIQDMRDKALEVMKLTQDELLINRAKAHLDQLNLLETERVSNA